MKNISLLSIIKNKIRLSIKNKWPLLHMLQIPNKNKNFEDGKISEIREVLGNYKDVLW